MIAHPSPNHGPRRGGLHPSLIVLHYTAMETAEAALERLCAPVAEVSAHYLIARTGQVFQLVSDDRRAWHAGAGSWAGQEDINSRSIGIELDNRGTHPFAEPLMQALERLISDLMARWNIPPTGVIGHSDMAPDRKTDPGPYFDWARLARRGLAGLPRRGVPDIISEETFIQAARANGFSASASFEHLLQATRLRYAPWRKGPLCTEDYHF